VIFSARWRFRGNPSSLNLWRASPGLWSAPYLAGLKDANAATWLASSEWRSREIKMQHPSIKPTAYCLWRLCRCKHLNGRYSMFWRQGSGKQNARRQRSRSWPQALGLAAPGRTRKSRGPQGDIDDPAAATAAVKEIEGAALRCVGDLVAA
jgi:hypothetical protein